VSDKIDLTQVSIDELKGEIDRKENLKINLCENDPIWVWQNYENSQYQGRVRCFHEIYNEGILCKDGRSKNESLCGHEKRDGKWKYNPNYGWIVCPGGPRYLGYDNYRIPTGPELEQAGFSENYYKNKGK